jgi:hypothetical protein
MQPWLLLPLLIAASHPAATPPAAASADRDLAERLAARLGARCDLEVLPCAGAGDAAARISQRLRSSSSAALLLRNCSDARDFPLLPTSWDNLRRRAAGTKLLLTTQASSRAQLGPALAEAGPQAICQGDGPPPPGYRGYCALARASPMPEISMREYTADMAAHLPVRICQNDGNCLTLLISVPPVISYQGSR